jgi:hypothetical protein
MSAMVWLKAQGASVFVPVGHSRDVDLIADLGEGPQRVQVKTSNLFVKNRWSVAVCTRGGNRSWSGVVKYLDSSLYEYLFALVGDGRRWFIPSREIAAKTRVTLGGPKYSEHEIARDPALRADLSSLDSATPWRGSRAVKGDAL